MTEWFAPLDGAARLIPLDPDGVTAWPDRAFAQSLQSLEVVPVGVSELLVMSQYLPMTMAKTEAGYELFANVSLRDCFAEDGRWRLSYKPICLRLLPFHASGDGKPFQIEDANNLTPPVQSENAQRIVTQTLKSHQTERREATELMTQVMELGLIEPTEDLLEPLRPGPNLADFEELLFAKEHMKAVNFFVAIAFSQRQHRRRPPLFDAVRDRVIFTPNRKKEHAQDFSSFLDYGKALNFD